MAKQKITRHEPDGPLRSGLMSLGDTLGPTRGGDMFFRAYDLANGGLDVVLDLHHEHKLGDPDHSIPPPYKTVGVLRERGTFEPALAEAAEHARL